MSDRKSKHQLKREEEFASHLGRMGLEVGMGDEGKAKISLRQIKSVGIHNLADVEICEIVVTHGFKSYFVKFKNGGDVSFAYAESGQLIDLSFNGVTAVFKARGEILFKPNSMSV